MVDDGPATGVRVPDDRLYRDGRRADALELYRRTRQVLVSELGIEPGPALTTLHERVLRDDPRLERPPAPLYAVRVGEDWLRGYATLAVWAGHLDLVDTPLVDRLLQQARERPDEAAAVLAEARVFRADLYACLTDPHDVRAFNAVAAVARRAAGAAVFTRGEDGLGRWRLPRPSGCRCPCSPPPTASAPLVLPGHLRQSAPARPALLTTAPGREPATSGVRGSARAEAVDGA